VFFGFWRGSAFAAATAQIQDNLTPEVLLEGDALSRSISDETPIAVESHETVDRTLAETAESNSPKSNGGKFQSIQEFGFHRSPEQGF
jgi:hypothetical protein